MQPNKGLFFTIIGAAILAVFGMLLVRIFLPDTLSQAVGPGQVDIEVVVAPSIRPWVESEARNFTQANPNIRVKVTTAGNLIPESQFQPTNPQIQPPAAWLAEAQFVIEAARARGLAFDDAQSVASTGLAWGAFTSKLEPFGGGLSWDAIYAQATSPNGIKLVIASPQNSAEGMAALISAAAGHQGTGQLTPNDVSAANAWLTETFGNRNTVIPATPATDFATKGVSAGDVGILSAASWRRARLDGRSDFTLTPTQPNVSLDYPFAIFNASPPQAQEAARAFRNFLLAANQQNTLVEVYLEPAGAVQSDAQVDGAAVQRLLDWANRELR